MIVSDEEHAIRVTYQYDGYALFLIPDTVASGRQKARAVTERPQWQAARACLWPPLTDVCDVRSICRPAVPPHLRSTPLARKQQKQQDAVWSEDATQPPGTRPKSARAASPLARDGGR